MKLLVISIAFFKILSLINCGAVNLEDERIHSHVSWNNINENQIN